MQLCEEYLKRHNLQFPFVRHVRQGSLFLDRSSGQFCSQWSILTIRWQNGHHHPGHYTIQEHRPKHNRAILLVEQREWHVEWDDYEEFILDLVEKLTCRSVMSENEIILVAWEMFLVINDSWMTQHIHSDRIWPTIDTYESTESRRSSLDSIITYIASNHEETYQEWRRFVSFHTSDYLYWLGDIISNNGNTQALASTGKESLV